MGLNKYMIATKAVHKLGDISRETPDLCIVSDEDESNYIGNWVFGYGYVDVKFPKDTTRDLTPEEIDKWHGSIYAIGSSMMGAINLKNENFRRKVCIKKEGEESARMGELFAPIKVGGRIAMFETNGGSFSTSRIQNIDGNRITTKNSVYLIEYEKE